MSDTKGTSSTAQNSVTAIDIVLEVDATMMQHAQAANAALRKNYPKGYSLDAEHKPHISVMGGYFYTASLDRTYAAVGKVLATEKVLSWRMKALKNLTSLSKNCLALLKIKKAKFNYLGSYISKNIIF